MKAVTLVAILMLLISTMVFAQDVPVPINAHITVNLNEDFGLQWGDEAEFSTVIPIETSITPGAITQTHQFISRIDEPQDFVFESGIDVNDPYTVKFTLASQIFTDHMTNALLAIQFYRVRARCRAACTINQTEYESQPNKWGMSPWVMIFGSPRLGIVLAIPRPE